MKNLTSLLFLIVAFSLNGAANILIKLGSAKRLKPPGSWTFLQLLVHNSLLITGLACFALNVVFYYLALKNLPLSSAYPVMVGMSFLIISTFSYVGLHEKISLLNIVGIILILAGIVAVSYKVA